MEGCGLDSSGSGLGLVISSWEHGNEPSKSINFMEIFWTNNKLLVSEEEADAMVLVW